MPLIPFRKSKFLHFVDKKQTRPMERMPTEPPPPYSAVVGDSPSALSSTEVPAVASAYRQSHPPPEYQPGPDNTCHRQIAEELQHRTSSHGRSAQDLSRAALAGKTALVRSLLEAGAEIYVPAASKPTSAIHDALRGPEPALALLMLDYPCERAYQSGSLSSTDGTQNCEDRVRFLLSAKDEKGCTPLHLAASAGAADVVRQMLELGAAIDALDGLGRTPLHMAARYGRTEAVDVLLEHGADVGLVHKSLWLSASPSSQAELGDYEFIRRTVRQAVTRMKRGNAESGVKGGCAQDTVDADVSESEDVDVRGKEYLQGEKSGSFDGSKLSAKSSGCSVGWDNFHASIPARRGAQLPYPAATARVLGAGASTSRLHPRPHRAAQKTTNTLVFSPEYMQWSRMCGTIQEEHRRQKERNAASGTGDGGIF